MFSSNSSQVSGAANYIEDVFSTYLYTGNGSTQTITNNIDLSTYGGLVWIKGRNSAFEFHTLFDTARGVNQVLQTQNADGSANFGNSLTAFNSTGFTLGTNRTDPSVNYASWTFRKQPNFFDVVTYTGTGVNRTVAHSLGSVPGSIIVKRTDTAAAWAVYHRSLANTQYMVLNTTAAAATGATWWNSTTPTSAVFSVGTDASVNASGGTYVAYIFAHDAGGFGLAGTDNVISCGSFTTDGSGNATVSLGYEPQWVMVKATSTTGSWLVEDVMRGLSQTNEEQLFANSSAAESSNGPPNDITINATGFTTANSNVIGNSITYIYIAIRRGPMEVPTTGTSVFTAETYSGNDTLNREFSVAPVQYSDLSWFISRNYPTAPVGISFVDRLRGALPKLWTGGTNSESTSQASVSFSNKMEAIVIATTGNFSGLNESGSSLVMYNLKRAPGFFDEVCYTGTGVNTTQAHNLGVVPELILVKRRDNTGAWDSYSSALANTEYVVVDTTAAKATGATRWNSTTPTASVFSIGTSTTTNASAGTYVAYLFASAPGVSEVGSYTGNGTTQTIHCGFTGGARFVLIKRTDATGDWYVYDTARGMTVLTDPYLLINSTAAETATLGSVTTVSTGFALDSAILAAINVNAGSYIFLAIA